jgi:hypothetical protein
MAETILSKLQAKVAPEKPNINEWYKAYTSEGFLAEYIIQDEDEIDFIFQNMANLSKQQQLVVFNNEQFDPNAGEVAAVTVGGILTSYAAALFGPLTWLAVGGPLVVVAGTGGLAGGVLKHLEGLEKEDEAPSLREAELFLKLWAKSGFTGKEVLINKIMLHISKSHPELTFDEVKILGDDFGWNTFNLKATEKINEYLEDPNMIVRTGVVMEVESVAYGGNELIFPYSLGGQIEQVAREAFSTVATAFVPYALFSESFRNIDNKDKISIEFEEQLEPLFGQDGVNYTYPFAQADPSKYNNLKNTVKLAGPLSSAKLEGDWGSSNALGEVLSDWFSRGGSLGAAETAYVEFLKPIMAKIRSSTSREQTERYYGDGSWETTFNKALNDLVDKVKESYAREIVNAVRNSVWEILSEELMGKAPGDDGANIDKILPDVFNKALLKVGEEHAGLIGDVTEKGLTEEQIAERQRFIKQCALMSNFSFMKSINRDLIDSKTGIHKDAPYGNRFYLLDDSRQRSSIPNKLLLPSLSKIKPVFEMTPDIHAFLIPKIRLFKVFNKENGELDQFEFLFQNFVNPSRVNNFGETFDKGDGAGIKSFSFSFEGTNPAVSRNDITAKLSLFFQSFDDFIRERKFPGNDKKHAYVDLILHPVTSKKKGHDTASFLQYDPSYYRIRADVGWVVDNSNNSGLEEVLKSRKLNFGKFNTALRTINKSFYLNMVDHDLNINDDGTVTINADFRAYMESAMKSSTLDILSTPKIKKQRKALQAKYHEILKENKCTMKELNKIKITMSQTSRELIKKSYQSIMQRMIERQSIFYVNADATSMGEYARNGYLSEPVKLNMIPIPKSPKQPAEIEKSAASEIYKDSVEDKSYTLDVAFKDVPLANEENWKTINFFFLGDLFYTLLDCAYLEDGKSYDVGAENLKLLLSSFDYDNLYDAKGEPSFANIADIPISAEYFFEWYTENVIKKEKQNYPIMTFIRDICNHLISNILLESCFKVSLDKTMRFQTGNFLANSKKGDVFLSEVNKEYRPGGVFDIKAMYENNILPFENESEGNSVQMKDYYNYIFLYAVSPATSHQGKGVRVDDGKVGIYHYQLGANKGLMKKIKFAKTDIQYLREARFFRNGHDGLMQLGNVYKVTMDMIGNTIYYPGMQFYVDPKGIGKGREFDPTIGPAEGRKASIANALGLGGYHLVTRVNSELASGKFNTTVEGMFVYSGDGNPAKITKGEEDLLSIERPISDSGKGTCPNTMNQVVDMFRDAKVGNHASIFKSLTEGPEKSKSTGVRTEEQKERAIKKDRDEAAYMGFEREEIQYNEDTEKLKRAQYGKTTVEYEDDPEMAAAVAQAKREQAARGKP